MTTFQAGFHEAGEPANPAIWNPINIFKRRNVASENLWSALFIKHHFLMYAKTVNGKYLTVLTHLIFLSPPQTWHTNSRQHGLIHGVWIALCNNRRKERREEMRIKMVTYPLHHLNTPWLCHKFSAHLRQVREQFVERSERNNSQFTRDQGKRSNSEERQTRNAKKNYHNLLS